MLNIYICGPTVYDKVHIGNLKPVITFDIFIRSQRFLGQSVNLIHNITDIDDKIIKKAEELNIAEAEVAKKNTDFYLKMLQAYNVQKPNSIPAVVPNMQGIIAFIKTLVENKNAYIIGNDVFFDVNSIKNYGQIAHRNLEEMIYESSNYKKHPADFALWKSTSKGVQFDSPWGKGRPGWHTECAYFIDKHMDGKPIDIHGGGIDLIFPHHENENAQYVAKNKNEIAKYFKHTGVIDFKGQKMSKSIGNLILADDFIEKFGANVLRYAFISSSQSAPINFSESSLSNFVNQVEKLERVYFKAKKINVVGKNITKNKKVRDIINHFAEWDFAKGLKDLQALIKEFNINQYNDMASEIILILDTLGFTFESKEIVEEDRLLIEKWKQHRENKEWAKADELRNKLVKKGLIN